MNQSFYQNQYYLVQNFKYISISLSCMFPKNLHQLFLGERLNMVIYLYFVSQNILTEGSRKKTFFLIARPLRGGG